MMAVIAAAHMVSTREKAFWATEGALAPVVEAGAGLLVNRSFIGQVKIYPSCFSVV
jgi:hypothetical protein